MSDKNPTILWLEFTLGGLQIPFYVGRIRGNFGEFNPAEWEVVLNVKQSAESAILTALHEAKHILLYLDNHREGWYGEEAEKACDKFATDWLQVSGGPPLDWAIAWDQAVAEWKHLKKSKENNGPESD